MLSNHAQSTQLSEKSALHMLKRTGHKNNLPRKKETSSSTHNRPPSTTLDKQKAKKINKRLEDEDSIRSKTKMDEKRIRRKDAKARSTMDDNCSLESLRPLCAVLSHRAFVLIPPQHDTSKTPLFERGALVSCGDEGIDGEGELSAKSLFAGKPPRYNPSCMASSSSSEDLIRRIVVDYREELSSVSFESMNREVETDSKSINGFSTRNPSKIKNGFTFFDSKSAFFPIVEASKTGTSLLPEEYLPKKTPEELSEEEQAFAVLRLGLSWRKSPEAYKDFCGAIVQGGKSSFGVACATCRPTMFLWGSSLFVFVRQLFGFVVAVFMCVLCMAMIEGKGVVLFTCFVLLLLYLISYSCCIRVAS